VQPTPGRTPPPPSRLEFQSSPIRRYHAQFTPALAVQPFTDFATFNGSGSVMSISHTNGSGGFYRQAELP
jgi:hypothetical protein